MTQHMYILSYKLPVQNEIHFWIRMDKIPNFDETRNKQVRRIILIYDRDILTISNCIAESLSVTSILST